MSIKALQITRVLDPKFFAEVTGLSGFAADIVTQYLNTYPLQPAQFNESSIEAHLKKQKIPIRLRFNPLPPIEPPTQANIEAYLKCFKTEYRESIKILFDKAVQYISFNDFKVGLASSVRALNQRLVESGSPSYSIGFIPRRSNEWVSSIALGFLAYLPTSWFHLDDCYVGENSLQLSEKVWVIMDDCSYSGLQVRAHGGGVILWLYSRLDAKNELNKISEYKIFILVPFMTNAAKKLIKEEVVSQMEILKNEKKLTSFPKVELITYHRSISMLQTTLKSYPVAMDCLKSMAYVGNCTLCYSQWKIPDPMSFVRLFGSTGFLEELLEKELNNKTDKKMLDQSYVRARIKENKLPEVIPDYYIQNANASFASPYK